MEWKQSRNIGNTSFVNLYSYSGLDKHGDTDWVLVKNDFPVELEYEVRTEKTLTYIYVGHNNLNPFAKSSEYYYVNLNKGGAWSIKDLLECSKHDFTIKYVLDDIKDILRELKLKELL